MGLLERWEDLPDYLAEVGRLFEAKFAACYALPDLTAPGVWWIRSGLSGLTVGACGVAAPAALGRSVRSRFGVDGEPPYANLLTIIDDDSY